MSSAWLIGIAYPCVVVCPCPFPEPPPYPLPDPSPNPELSPKPDPGPNPGPLPDAARVAVLVVPVVADVCPGRPWPPLLPPDPATSTPTTSPAEFANGPPESPAWMLASVWIRLVRFSGSCPLSSVAVIDWFSPVTLPAA